MTVEIEKYKSLCVKVNGGCCKLPEPIRTIYFVSVVRGQETQEVVISNNTNHPWKLKVEVSGDYFTVEEILHVPAKGSAFCIVTYAPIVMNTEDTQHVVIKLITSFVS